MPDRVHHPPNLIYSPGTQVVTLVEVLGQRGPEDPEHGPPTQMGVFTIRS